MNKVCLPIGSTKKILLIISQACLLGISFPSFAATLVIELPNKQPQGIVHAALYNQTSTDWNSSPQLVEQTAGERIIFEDLPPGQYAVQLFQDINANGRLDSTRRGVPKEPVGFSNNPALIDGKPDIQECWLNLTEPQTTETIRLFTRKTITRKAK